MRILNLEFVTGDDRHLVDGDTLLARFVVELDGAEYPGRLLRSYRDAVEVRIPRGRRRLGPLARRELARLAFAAFKSAGGVEPAQPVVGA